jgi:sec-independent protein translocase protein TatB
MLGLSWTELLVVGIVALIVIGPKDLPVVMGRIGKVVGQIQRMGREFQREINRTTGLDEVRNLRNSITDPLKKTADEIRKEFNAIGKDGQHKPTGVLKPTDPSVESVADAIKEQAGMTPVKSSTELASDYGFKPQAAKPVAGTRTTPPSFSDTEAAKSTAKPAAKKTAKPRAAAAVKPAEPVKAARPKPAASKPAEAARTPAVDVPSEARPVRKVRAKAPAVTPAEPVAEAAPVVKKPRAPRNKPADTAEKS